MGKSNLIKIAALLLVMALAIIALIPEKSTDNNLTGKEKTQQILMDDAGKQVLIILLYNDDRFAQILRNGHFILQTLKKVVVILTKIIFEILLNPHNIRI